MEEESIPNGLVSYNDLCILVELGVINAPLENINGTSIDVTLDKFVCVEDLSGGMTKVNLAKGENIRFKKPVDIAELGYMMPNTVLLASTFETLNMPNWLSSEYSLKSSLARNYLAHALAGWIDPGFSGKITLELKNETQFHKLILTEGMKIGQIKFFKHPPVPKNKSYAVRGQYNGQDKVQPSKGVK